MIIPSQAVKIVVATKPVDFRKGHDGLAAVVQNELGLDPHSGIIVVFRAKRGDRIKVLLWDGSGLVMAYKRLEQGKFAWPTSQACKNMPCRPTGISDGVMRVPVVASCGDSEPQFKTRFRFF
ncbi:MAG: IS66 family insertion sequence element accessory protein TnpB [Alphaproteobacteria bacterium]|nr:IS66 family insertion sequence element accessory protein TnpB [Alphaproteobacteria bacterium]